MVVLIHLTLKGLYFGPIQVISGFTDKGQFQFPTAFKGPKEGTYLHKTKFISLDKY